MRVGDNLCSTNHRSQSSLLLQISNRPRRSPRTPSRCYQYPIHPQQALAQAPPLVQIPQHPKRNGHGRLEYPCPDCLHQFKEESDLRLHCAIGTWCGGTTRYNGRVLMTGMGARLPTLPNGKYKCPHPDCPKECQKPKYAMRHFTRISPHR